LSLFAALAAIGLAGSLPSACTPAKPYRPVVPSAHRASVQGLEAEIVQIETAYGFRVLLKVRGDRDARITRALLAPSAASPCREGVRDEGLLVDGKVEWLRPVRVSGEHEVLVTFPAGAAGDLIAKTPVVDLVLPTETKGADDCLRLPISGEAPELALARDMSWSVNWAARLVYPSHPVRSVDNGWSLDFGAGRWFGPIRARAEVGAGISDCKGDCPPQPHGGEGFTWFPLRLALDGYVFETRGFGIAAELGYELSSARRLNPDESTRWETNHGPRGAVRLDFTPLMPQGWPWGGRQSAFGLELSLGRWASEEDGAALVWGIGLVNFVGF
jgi:hypothetical protein